LALVGVIGAVVGALGTYVALGSPSATVTEEPTRDAVIHDMGHEVMPFSLDETVHVFEMTSTGGVQEVIADDPGDQAQIQLIRQHLAHEATRFQKGDFRDPGSLHGTDMPGVRELSAGADRLRVTYDDLPAGGRIVYVVSEAELVTAVHRWFGAQLSDHGADATYR
jgi:hypothetical protein